MAKRRANGGGGIRKLQDGRWEGRYTAGRDPETGKAIYKNVLSKSQAEVKKKLKHAIEERAGLDVAEGSCIGNHIKPNIGSIPPKQMIFSEFKEVL